MTEIGRELVKTNTGEPTQITLTEAWKRAAQRHENKHGAGIESPKRGSLLGLVNMRISRIHPELPDDSRLRALNLEADLSRFWMPR